MAERIDAWITWAIGNYTWKYGLQGEYFSAHAITLAAMDGYEQKGREMPAPASWDLIEARCQQWRDGKQDEALA